HGGRFARAPGPAHRLRPHERRQTALEQIIATRSTRAARSPASAAAPFKRPEDYRPQAALLVDVPPSGTQWLHELKLDGHRIGLFKSNKTVSLISRRGVDYSHDFPEISEAARGLAARTAVLDGEVVVLDKRGISSFQALQQLGSTRRGVTYFAFDLLSMDGE